MSQILSLTGMSLLLVAVSSQDAPSGSVGAIVDADHLRAEYQLAGKMLREAASNCELSGHIVERVLVPRQTRPRLDTAFLFKQCDQRQLVLYEDKQEQLCVHVFTPELAFNLGGGDKDQPAIRKHTSDPEYLKTQAFRTGVLGGTFLNAAFMAYDVDVALIFDQNSCEITSVKIDDERSNSLEIAFRFTLPNFYQDGGIVVLDRSRNLALREYDLAKIDRINKATILTRGVIDYPDENVGEGNSRSPSDLERLLPSHVEIRLATQFDNGEFAKSEEWLATSITARAGSVSPRDFTLSAFGLPELPPDQSPDLHKPWAESRSLTLWVVVNVVLLGSLVFLWLPRRRRKS